MPPGNDVGKQQVQRTWGRNKLDKLEEKQGGECDCSGVSWGRVGTGESERSAGARPSRALEAMVGSLDCILRAIRSP